MLAQGQNENGQSRYKLAGLVIGVGILIAMTISPKPVGVSNQAWAVAAVGLLMAIWWMTEAAPLATTALLPLVLFPILDISNLKTTATSYAHPLIFLFLGGFMLARAMERWNLHRRIALHILRLGGHKPSSVIFSFMLATAFLSMWVSNTATAMMMLPIGQSVATTIARQSQPPNNGGLTTFSAALMLGIAYAATIGGMGTLIGTPPNALFAGFMHETYGMEIGFFQWMLVGIPVVVILLPVTWFVLTRVAFRFSLTDLGAQGDAMAAEITSLDPMSRGEALVAALMAITAAGWIFRALLNKLLPGIAISDAGIAMTAAVLLFIIPVQWSKGRFLLSWSEAIALRWDVLILFGGGLALAASINDSGLAHWIGGPLSALSNLPVIWLVLAVMIVVVYLGELASNTAMAAIFLPIAGAAAVGMGVSPLVLTFPVALAASLGFMLPVATPPNAIIFGSGAITAQQMLRAGAILDIISIGIVALIGTTIGFWALELTGDGGVIGIASSIKLSLPL